MDGMIVLNALRQGGSDDMDGALFDGLCSIWPAVVELLDDGLSSRLERIGFPVGRLILG